MPRGRPQHTATRCNPLQPTATHCNPLQHNILLTSYHAERPPEKLQHYNTLQHTEPYCVCHVESPREKLRHTTTHCNTLQHTTYTPCGTPSRKAATHYNTLPHTATHCSILLTRLAERPPEKHLHTLRNVIHPLCAHILAFRFLHKRWKTKKQMSTMRL